MWSILGEESDYLDIPYKFRDNLMKLVPEGEKGKRFAELMGKTEVEYMLNGQTEESCFMFRVPDEYTPDDIQLMADVIIESLKRFDGPAIVVDKTEQKYKILVSNNKEPQIIGLHKTPGMSSMEVFKPIIEGWASPGRANPSLSRFYRDDDDES